MAADSERPPGVVITHYDILGVSPTASPDDVARACSYVRSNDKNKNNVDQLMRHVDEAWKTLSDPIKRAAYNASLGITASISPNRPPPSHRAEDRDADEAEYELWRAEYHDAREGRGGTGLFYDDVSQNPLWWAVILVIIYVTYHC